MRYPTMTPVERLLSRMEETESGCLMWTGQISQDGYARLWVDGKPREAHRVAYEWFVGSLPDGYVIDHLCRNRACVNPDHMEPVTPGENGRRGFGCSAVNARKTHCIRGHEFDEENTYRYRDGHRSCRKCMRMRSRRRLRRAGVSE